MSAENVLYYGVNLDVLRQHAKDESVDLVYLDPPFNSNAGYNVLFEEQSGERSAAQIRAFEDGGDSAEEVSWQLGHKSSIVTRTVYIPRDHVGGAPN